MQIYVVLAFIAYFSILLFIGVVVHHKQSSSSDFIMGNRSLNFWLVALSAHASDMSAWLFMAFPMTIFVSGLSHAWIAMGLLTGMLLNWRFVATRLRLMTEHYKCYTLSSFFEKRYEDTSGTIKLISAIAMIIFMTHYLSAGLIGMGILLEALFGMNYYFGLSVAMVVVIIYTFIGGFTTVAWTDFFQAVFLLIMILLVPLIAFNFIGGIGPILEIAHEKNISLSLGFEGIEGFINVFSLAFGWGLGYFGMPHIITKFMGIKDPAKLKKSMLVGMSWQIVTLAAATCIGLIGIAFFPEGLAVPEMVFIEMVKVLFHPFVAGFILCAVIAANMSTMDSQVLVCASIVSEDLFKQLRKSPPTDFQVLWASKISVVVIALVALLISFNRSATVLGTVLYSWSGLGSAFGPLVLVSLYSKKTNLYGAIAGIIVGATAVMIWPQINPMVTTYTILPMIPGFISSLISIYLVSFLTRGKQSYVIGQGY